MGASRRPISRDPREKGKLLQSRAKLHVTIDLTSGFQQTEAENTGAHQQ